jgi:hypothetical protein
MCEKLSGKRKSLNSLGVGLIILVEGESTLATALLMRITCSITIPLYHTGMPESGSFAMFHMTHNPCPLMDVTFYVGVGHQHVVLRGPTSTEGVKQAFKM